MASKNEDEGVEDGESQASSNGHNRDEIENPGRRPVRQSGRTEHITEMRVETMQGFDELTSCINSVDDHVQTALQELRNCVANLRRERTEMSQKLRTLSEELFHVSSERDGCRQAIVELQQETTSLREQLCSQQQDKESMLQRMQEIQQQHEDHLVKIAGRQRSRRLAHSAIVRWRRNTIENQLDVREKLRRLEKENNELRAEILLIQEAAKQAFLRSANALNSEALTVFQDAATRLMGFEEVSPQESTASHYSPSNSPIPEAYTSQENDVGEDKENAERSRDSRNIRGIDRDRHPGKRDGSRHEDLGGSSNDRSFAAHHGSYQPSTSYHRVHFDHSNHGGYGDPSVYHFAGVMPVGPHQYSPAFGGTGTKDSSVPLQTTQHPSTPELDQEYLRQKSRAYLHQLCENRRRRPQTPLVSGFESQRKTQKTLASHHDPKHKICNCRSGVGVNAGDAQIPYKCPYCSPVQNSSFRHARDTKPSNVARADILAGNNTNKKVIYKPSASTVVIEKHITK